MENSNETLFKIIQQKIDDGVLDHILKTFQKRLELSFDQNGSFTPNLCLKNAEEVREEYKTTFTLQDLVNYLTAKGMNHTNFKIEKIHIPKDSATFWKLIRRGK